MIENSIGQDKLKKSRKRRSIKPRTLISLVLLVGAALWLKPAVSRWLDSDTRVDSQQLQTAQVIAGEFSQDVAATGEVVAINSPQVYSRERGAAQLLVKPGEQIKRGQVIAEVDSPELLNLYAQQKASLAQAKIQSQRQSLQDQVTLATMERDKDRALVALNAAKRELKRAVISRQQDVISDIDFQQRQDAEQAAQLTFKHANKAYDLAEKMNQFEVTARQFEIEQQSLVVAELSRRIEGLSLKSPVNGIVGNWLIDDGSQVVNQQALMSIVDLSELEIQLNVPAIYADTISPGLNAKIRVAGKQLDARISHISPELRNNMLIVHATPISEQQTTVTLRQRQQVTAKIHIASQADSILVPRGPFFDSGRRQFVFRIGDNQLAHKVPVTYGRIGTEHLQILSGLQAGDVIISSTVTEFADAETIYLQP